MRPLWLLLVVAALALLLAPARSEGAWLELRYPVVPETPASESHRLALPPGDGREPAREPPPALPLRLPLDDAASATVPSFLVGFARISADGADAMSGADDDDDGPGDEAPCDCEYGSRLTLGTDLVDLLGVYRETEAADGVRLGLRLRLGAIGTLDVAGFLDGLAWGSARHGARLALRLEF